MNQLKALKDGSYKLLLSFKRLRYLLSAHMIFYLLLIQITASGAQAQSCSDMKIPVPHPITSLLRSTVVHRELGLSATEIKDVEKVVSEFDLPLWRLRDLPPQKCNKSATQHIDQLRTKLAQTLSKRQIKRLDQLEWQARGIEIILEPQNAIKLSLSPEQDNRIRMLLSTLQSEIISLKNNTAISTESLRVAYIQKLQAEIQSNIVTVLNSYQQNILTTLMGRPFDFSQVRVIACKAPEIETDTWINSSPVSLSGQRGKVTVVHFYAFGCGNCTRTLPYYNDWHKHFPKSSLSIIGIHRPETKQERNIDKVKDKAAQARMEYPVAVDNDSLAWNSWANNIWPSIYLIDKNGFIRYWWYGELNWQGAESEKFLKQRIRELIDEPPEAQNAIGT
ncbi:MAG: redoxin domain-containing protein [Planctomycetes bacterium]|nr:redoxin domain-containing protein [Planctomycetota bacterium]